ncbi:MAG TPA: V-type ATP synthase subunit A [Candidatus Dormibacteraeota bacterium]|nr:V-type ATP synthase subunit A [Candidatus Dormibacteraeota bacterium]
MSDPSTGTVVSVNGPVVDVEGLHDVALAELLDIGVDRLPAEAVTIRDGVLTAQVYAYTGGLSAGATAHALGRPLSVALGPGLLGGVFDGTMRRLDKSADFVGFEPAARSDQTWNFTRRATIGQQLRPGDVLGVIRETAAIEHRLLVPPNVRGTLTWIASDGPHTSEDRLAVIDDAEVGFSNFWPVRKPRPVRRRIPASIPLVTGQRVLDLLYPIAKGSTACVPGGFGTGKTMLLQQIAKWSDADVIVYVGCGERGNEMADVLDELPRLVDPRTGKALMDRTIVIANTSNMPVMAREASIYSGVTVAEYFRDMGYHAIVIADSTSRWAEALREFASRTGQLPAEEGYPATLSSALAAFYERAGMVETLNGHPGSVTVIGAVSPPGGDFTEPVTAHTRRFVRSLWSLDRDLAYARHYPAVGWTDSFSRDAERLGPWQVAHGDPAWSARRDQALALLAEGDRLRSMAELVGSSALPDRERVVLKSAELVRTAVLQQSALSPNDAYCAPAKQAALMDSVLQVHQRCLDLVHTGVPMSLIEDVDMSTLSRAKDAGPSDDTTAASKARDGVIAQLEVLR